MADNQSTYTLDEVVRALTSVSSELRAITDQLRTDFVRKETYRSDQKANDRRHEVNESDIKALQDGRSNDQAWRRSTSVTIALAAIGWLLTIVGLLVAVLR